MSDDEERVTKPFKFVTGEITYAQESSLLMRVLIRNIF